MSADQIPLTRTGSEEVSLLPCFGGYEWRNELISCLGYRWRYSLLVLQGWSIYYEQCADYRWRKIVDYAGDVLDKLYSLYSWPLGLDIREEQHGFLLATVTLASFGVCLEPENRAIFFMLCI